MRAARGAAADARRTLGSERLTTLRAARRVERLPAWLRRGALNGRIEHEIAALISTGLPLSTAARLAGVPPRTARDWLHLGQQPDAAKHWQQFAASVASARLKHDQQVALRLARLRGRL